MNIEPILHKKTFQELTTDELYELLRVRSEVFVVEQNCVYQDMDGDDQMSIHLWLTVADKLVALARVCPAGTHMKEISIGRVITTERGKGYGLPPEGLFITFLCRISQIFGRYRDAHYLCTQKRLFK